MSESAKRHEENSNLIKEIRASTDAAIRNQEASIKTMEIQIGQMSNVLQERGFGSLPSSTKTNPRDQVKSISTTIKADSYPIRRIGSSQYAVEPLDRRNYTYLQARQTTVPIFNDRLDDHYYEEEEGNYRPKFTEIYGALHINNTIPRKEKDPGSFTLPCFINDVCFDNALVDLGASDMDAYRDDGMGDVIFGEPFLREVGIKTKRFKGIITLYNGDDRSNTYKCAITIRGPRERNIDEVGGMHIF
ncbi:hypothetical protein Tco_0269151 [Tanacetum coccineum]